MPKPKWKEGNRKHIVAALDTILKPKPKLTAKNFAKALGTEFEFKVGELGGIGGRNCQQIWKPEGGIPTHGCPQLWKPTGGTGTGGCHIVMKPLGGVGGGKCALVWEPMGIPAHGCAPASKVSERGAAVIHLRSLVKKPAKKRASNDRTALQFNGDRARIARPRPRNKL